MSKLDLDIPKQHGHRQAMTNTFMRLKTRPEEYTPIYQKSNFNQVTHCDLCGAALTYSFDLVHAEDLEFTKGWSLKVGADCIYNFCQIYFPTIAEQILKTIEKSVLTSKIGKFNHDNPNLKENIQVLKDLLNDYKKQYGYSFTKLKTIEGCVKAMNELHRQEYISKPKIELINSTYNWLKEEKTIKLLSDHKEFKKQPLSECSKKYLKFHETYKELFGLTNYYAYNNNCDFSISELDQMLFKERVNDLIKKAIKSKFKQYDSYPQLYQYLITQSFEPYSAESSAQSQIKRLYPLNEYQINKITSSERYLQSIKNLPSMNSLWHNIFNNISKGINYEI